MSAYLTAQNRARLGINDAQHQQFLALLSEWNSAYTAYTNPQAHDDAAVLAMRRSYTSMDALVRGLRLQIKHNRALTLTSEDYQSLGIHRDKQTRTRATAPEHAPIIALLGTTHLENEFQVQQPDSEHFHHLALPPGPKLARKLAVTAPGSPAPTPQDYRPIDASGKSKFKLIFAPADEGNIGYLICAYFNRRGEHGPQSPPLRFYII